MIRKYAVQNQMTPVMMKDMKTIALPASFAAFARLSYFMVTRSTFRSMALLASSAKRGRKAEVESIALARIGIGIRKKAI